ncbi:MAG UNVERIFIED_CONTAM: hypothetical protein LVT10_09775 [Anaerolineae bacterium]
MSVLAIASLAFIVTPVELWLTGHYENALQWIPFILCGMGLVAIGTVYFHPARWSVWGLRLVMVVVGVGGVWGWSYTSSTTSISSWKSAQCDRHRRYLKCIARGKSAPCPRHLGLWGNARFAFHLCPPGVHAEIKSP